MNGFIPSAANQALLQHTASHLDVLFLTHVAPGTHKGACARDVPVEIAAVVRTAMHCVEGREGEGGGQGVGRQAELVWRVEEAQGKECEEWVLFTVWDKVENHMAFADSVEGKEHLTAIQGLLKDMEVKHARNLLMERGDRRRRYHQFSPISQSWTFPRITLSYTRAWALLRARVCHISSREIRSCKRLQQTAVLGSRLFTSSLRLAFRHRRFGCRGTIMAFMRVAS